MTRKRKTTKRDRLMELVEDDLDQVVGGTEQVSFNFTKITQTYNHDAISNRDGTSNTFFVGERDA